MIFLRHLLKKTQNIQIKNKIYSQKVQFSTLIHEIQDDLYDQQNIEEFKQLYNIKSSEIIKGYATDQGTKLYSEKKPEIIAQNHFKKPFIDNLSLSTVGIGTYTGTPDSKDDLKMFNAIIDSVKTGGVNVIDTAINYRYMKSERTVGAALKFLIKNKIAERNQLFVASKGGYVPEDADNGVAGQFMIKDLIEKQLISKDDVVTEIHCLHPNFLKIMLETSLNNLGLETLDLYYLHNSAEQQMSLLGEQVYFERLSKAFEFCQKMIQENKIRSFGLATWLSFRSNKDEDKIYLNLQKVKELADKVCGPNNGLKYIQVPINIMMPEAFVENWQNFKNPDGQNEMLPLLTAARLLNINIFTSSPLMQGAMMQVPLPTDIFKCKNLGAKHIQFVRSIPSDAIISTLIGQKTNRHTKMNLEVIQHSPLTTEEFWEFLLPKQREQKPEEAIEID